MTTLKDLKPKTLFVVKQPKRENFREGPLGDTDFKKASYYPIWYSAMQWVSTGIKHGWKKNELYIIPITEIGKFQGDKCNQFPPKPMQVTLWGDQGVEVVQDETEDFSLAQFLAYLRYEGWKQHPAMFNKVIRDSVNKCPGPGCSGDFYQNPQLAEATIVALQQISDREEEIYYQKRELEERLYDESLEAHLKSI